MLFLLAERKIPSVYPIYGVVGLLGVVRSFNFPAARAILPQLVPEVHFSNAVAWSSRIFQTATILGPTFGGLLYAFFGGPEFVYAAAMITGVIAAMAMTRVKAREKARPREPINLQTVFAGFHYIWREKLILGSISLDLFAVLLGGAVALLPVYARTILQTGPWGLGTAAQRSGSRRGSDGRAARPSSVAASGRAGHAALRRRLRHLHHRLWIPAPNRFCLGLFRSCWSALATW